MSITEIKCGYCKHKKPIEQFKLKSDGVIYKTCQACCDENKKGIKERREVLLAKLVPDKIEAKCGLCHIVKPIVEFKMKLTGITCTNCLACNKKQNEHQRRNIKKYIEREKGHAVLLNLAIDKEHAIHIEKISQE